MITFDEIRIQFSDSRLGGPVHTSGLVTIRDPEIANRAMSGEPIAPGILATNLRPSSTFDVQGLGPVEIPGMDRRTGTVYRGEASFFVETDPPSWVVSDASGKKFRLTLEALP